MPATLPLAPHPATVETPRSETHDIDAILSHSETSKREKIMAINRLAIPGPLKMAGIRAATSVSKPWRRGRLFRRWIRRYKRSGTIYAGSSRRRTPARWKRPSTP